MRRVLALIPSHSSFTFPSTLWASRKVDQKSADKSTLLCKCRATSTKAAAVRRSGETFLRESAPCCQIFSFFFFPSLFFFSPCCHSGFLTAAQRESVRAWKRKSNSVEVCVHFRPFMNIYKVSEFKASRKLSGLGRS